MGRSEEEVVTASSGYQIDRQLEHRFIQRQWKEWLDCFAPAPGIRSGLRAHAEDIAIACSGGLAREDWEMPIGCMMTCEITSPVYLPEDIYYVPCGR